METNQLRLAVYTGSFDPITLGHLNVIQRGSRLVDRLIVGVGINIEKQPLFSPEERVAMIRAGDAGVGERRGSHVPRLGGRVRAGVPGPGDDPRRSPADRLSAEFTMMMANRQLADDVETLFMMADGELAHVSSRLIKQIAPVHRRRHAGPLRAAGDHCRHPREDLAGRRQWRAAVKSGSQPSQ